MPLMDLMIDMIVIILVHEKGLKDEIRDTEADSISAIAHVTLLTICVHRADPDLETNVRNGAINAPCISPSLFEMSC